MPASPKPIDQQVIVITGASSGIGLATAQLAAGRGARVVLAARSIDALEQIAGELNSVTHKALAVECDVSDRAQIEHVVSQTITTFGRIDTWVNNAGVSTYGRLDEITDEDARRMFDVNFWGVVNGSTAALPFLKMSHGVLINVGSEVSETVAPMLGMYAATKFAVKGYTDALRLEIQEIDKAPISICLVQPTATNTPFPQHGKNDMPYEATLPSPVQEPVKVAEAICDLAVNPKNAVKVGLMATINVAMTKMMPGLATKMAAGRVHDVHTDEPARHQEGALYRPSQETASVGRTKGDLEQQRARDKANKDMPGRDA